MSDQVIPEEITPSPLAGVVKFTSAQFNQLEERARQEWETKHLGPRPTKAQVRKSIPNLHGLNFIQWLAVLLLLVLTVFTSIKVAISAGPYVTDLVSHIVAGTFYVSEDITSFFTAVTMALAMFISTPGLIYFQLLRDDPEIRQQQARHPLRRRKAITVLANYFLLTEPDPNKPQRVSLGEYEILSDDDRKLYHRPKKDKLVWEWNIGLDSVSPRLPSLIVYGITAWLFVLGNIGGNNIFLQNLPVIIEVGLAHLVGDIIRRQQLQAQIVQQAWEAQVQPWDEKKAGYRKQPTYSATLYNILRDAAPNLVRSGTNNKRLLDDDKLLDLLIKETYKAYTSNERFAQWVIIEEERAAAALSSLGELSTSDGDKEFRLPPNGESEWTPETLLRDLLAINAPKDITRNWVLEKYGTGYKASPAWAVVKPQFLAHHGISQGGNNAR